MLSKSTLRESQKDQLNCNSTRDLPQMILAIAAEEAENNNNSFLSFHKDKLMIAPHKQQTINMQTNEI